MNIPPIITRINRACIGLLIALVLIVAYCVVIVEYYQRTNPEEFSGEIPNDRIQFQDTAVDMGLWEGTARFHSWLSNVVLLMLVAFLFDWYLFFGGKEFCKKNVLIQKE